MFPPARRDRGSALLAVLWLSVALSVIAFTVASTVRGEIDRAATASDDTRAYYLAQGGIQRAILYIEWGRTYGQVPGQTVYYMPGMSPLQFHFPGGDASVDVIPESSKLNINNCLPGDFFQLLIALGVAPDRAQMITEAVVDWRTPAPPGQPTGLDLLYLQQTPSFMATHTSFKEIEELLLVRGMTPDIFYGTWDRDDRVQPPRLSQHIGLRDCVSIYSNGTFDVNTTPLPTMVALGIAPDAAAAIVQQRNVQPFTSLVTLRAFTQNMGPAAFRLTLGGASIFTLRATGRPRSAGGALTDMKRSCAALIKLAPPDTGQLFHILRWYDRG